MIDPASRFRPPVVTRRQAFAAGGSGLALVALGGCSPAGLLNNVSRLVDGGGAVRAASGVPYASGTRQKLDVWAPAQRTSPAPLPVVIFFYGGGWVAGDRGDYGFAGRAFAGRQFIAIVPDYRLVPDVRFPAFVEDGALAVKWTLDNVARFGGDPRRIGVAGHSAGAYIGAMLSLDRRYLLAANATPDTIRATALLAGPYDFYPFTERRGRDALGAWPRPLETQPITFARRDAPPMLLMHGTRDTVVRPYNSANLASRLRALGADAELRVYEGASHVDLVKSLAAPFRNSTPALADSVNFLKERLRGTGPLQSGT